MRILHLVFSSRIAGSERYCIDLANRQAALGHEVHLAGAPNSPVAAALAPQVQFHGFNRFLRGLRVRRMIRKLAPDICHAHLSQACKALRRGTGGSRTVATLHVGYKAHQHASLDGLICVNRAQRGRLSGYDGHAKTIANWMPAPPLGAPALDIRKELGLSDDVFLIGAVGRLHPSKGMNVLISAFKAAAPNWAALVILGDGPQRAELERLCGGDSRIHLVGYREAVGEFLNDLDLFVSPSNEESFGLAILEAMSNGLPIIATATEGPAEFLRDQPVKLIPIGSVVELTAALAQASDLFERDGLCRQGYDLSPFEAEARVEDVLSFYRQVASTALPQPIETAAIEGVAP